MSNGLGVGWVRFNERKAHWFAEDSFVSLCHKAYNGTRARLSGQPMHMCGVCLGMRSRMQREAPQPPPTQVAPRPPARRPT